MEIEKAIEMAKSRTEPLIGKVLIAEFKLPDIIAAAYLQGVKDAVEVMS